MRIFLFLFALLFSIYAQANPEALIEKTLKVLAVQLKAMPQDAALAEVRHVLKTHFEPLLDMERMSKVALGPYWKRASFEQKQRFIQCFTRQLRHTQAPSFLKWHGNHWQITATKFNERGSKAAVSIRLTMQNRERSILLRLYKSKQQWRIYDAALDGLSLLKSFRDDYSIKIESMGLNKSLARLCQQYPAPSKTLTMAANEWPPYVGRSLPGQGLAIELIRQVFKQAGYDIQMNFAPWGAVREGLKAGKYDISSTNWKTPEREKSLLFSQPYLENKLIVISHDTLITNEQAFKDALLKHKHKLGLIRDYAYGDIIPEGVISEYHQHYTPLLRKLSSKELDLVLLDACVAQYYLQSQPQLKSHLQVSTTPVYSKSLHLTMLKAHPVAHKVIDDFNESLSRYLGSKPHLDLLARYRLKYKKH